MAISFCALVLAACGGPDTKDRTLPSPAERDLPRLIERDDLFGNPDLAGAQISPDGKYVSFRQQYKGKMNVWVKEAGAPFDDARPVTADTERPISAYFWSEDSERILFAQDQGGDENYRIYAVDPMGEADDELGVPEARDLTPIEDVRAQIIDVPEATPNKILVGLNDRDPQVHDVYRLDLQSGERELLIENTESVAGWQADHEGEVRVATRQNEDGGTDIHWVREGELSDEPFYSCTALESCGAVGFHKDNERVYLTTNRGDDVDLIRLVLFDPEREELEVVESDPEGEVDFGGTVFNEDDELIGTYYVSHSGYRYYAHDDQFARDLEFLEQELPKGDISFGAATKDETRQIVSIQSDVDPGSTYLYNREDESLEKLYVSRPELESEELATMEPITYPARDGLEIPAYLTLPAGARAENLPTLIVPHGGPWHRDTWSYTPTAQFFANRGYAVLQPNFRGSTGYGKEFLNAGNGEWGDAMQDDLTDGVDYLIEEGIADPDRVGIYGGSYGGYATLAGLAFTSDRYAAGASLVGPSSILTLLDSIPPYWAPLIEMFHTRVGDPEDPEDRERLKRQSPLFSADQIEAPLMVIQGANDPRVIQRESDQIVVAARENGVDVEYLVAENEGHGFRNEENRLAYTAAVEEFFAEHLGGRYQEDLSPAAEEALARMRTDVEAVEVAEASGEAPAPAGLPDVDSSVLETTTLRYDMKIEAQGREMDASVVRKLEESSQDDQKAWKIRERAEQGENRENSQTYWLDASTLRTLRQEGSGRMELDLRFAKDAITGSVSAMGNEVKVEESLDGPVLGSGGTDTGIVFAALPLDEDYETAYRTYDVQQQAIQHHKLAVTGTDSVEMDGDSFETYVLHIEAPKADIERRVHVMKEAPHHVVRSTATLSPQMGGATVTMKLRGVE